MHAQPMFISGFCPKKGKCLVPESKGEGGRGNLLLNIVKANYWGGGTNPKGRGRKLPPPGSPEIAHKATYLLISSD